MNGETNCRTCAQDGSISSAPHSAKEARFERWHTVRSHYTVFWKRQNYGDKEVISGCQGLEVERKNWQQRDTRELSGVRKLLYVWIWAGVIKLYSFVKTHKTIHWKGWTLLCVNYSSNIYVCIYIYLQILHPALSSSPSFFPSVRTKWEIVSLETLWLKLL